MRLPVLMGMVQTWFSQGGLVLDEDAPDPKPLAGDRIGRSDLSHHRWPEWDPAVRAVVPVAPGAAPGDHRDMKFRAAYLQLQERRRKREEAEAAAAAAGQE